MVSLICSRTFFKCLNLGQNKYRVTLFLLPSLSLFIFKNFLHVFPYSGSFYVLFWLLEMSKTGLNKRYLQCVKTVKEKKISKCRLYKELPLIRFDRNWLRIKIDNWQKKFNVDSEHMNRCSIYLVIREI